MLPVGAKACSSLWFRSNSKEEVTLGNLWKRAVKIKTVFWAVFKDTVGGFYHWEQMFLRSCQCEIDPEVTLRRHSQANPLFWRGWVGRSTCYKSQTVHSGGFTDCVSVCFIDDGIESVFSGWCCCRQSVQPQKHFVVTRVTLHKRTTPEER